MRTRRGVDVAWAKGWPFFAAGPESWRSRIMSFPFPNGYRSQALHFIILGNPLRINRELAFSIVFEGKRFFPNGKAKETARTCPEILPKAV